MKSKGAKITYWIVTFIFILMMLPDGLAGVMRVEAAKEALGYLGYPEYVSSIVGFAKISGAIALLQPVFRAVKEWAYAGFAFIFLGAFWSHFSVGSSIGFVILPLLMLAITFLSYFLWRKVEKEQI